MITPKNPLIRNLLIISTAVIYLFIAVAHIFYLPKVNNSGKKTHYSVNSIFKRKTEIFSADIDALNLIRQIDKSTIVDKRALADLLKPGFKYFCILLFLPLVFRPKPETLPDKVWHTRNHQGFYLCICAFKI